MLALQVPDLNDSEDVYMASGRGCQSKPSVVMVWQAIERLQTASRYEAAAEFWPQHVRGGSYLKLGKAAEAAAEFQKILRSRGQSSLSALHPLAHLGLARAAALSGDAAKSRPAYQDFLALRKDADADLPILIEAKKEYDRLK